MTYSDEQPEFETSFLVESLVGETIERLFGLENGVILRMESGLQVKVKNSYSADIEGERIAGFELQFPKNPKVITLNFASGRRVVIEL